MDSDDELANGTLAVRSPDHSSHALLTNKPTQSDRQQNRSSIAQNKTKALSLNTRNKSLERSSSESGSSKNSNYDDEKASSDSSRSSDHSDGSRKPDSVIRSGDQNLARVSEELAEMYIKPTKK